MFMFFEIQMNYGYDKNNSQDKSICFGMTSGWLSYCQVDGFFCQKHSGLIACEIVLWFLAFTEG